MKIGVVAFVALALVTQAEEHAGAFIVPDDDLPYVFVAGHEVAFAPNGACVVGRSGRWLFDCGLSYAMEGWNEWGTQIRRSDAQDCWRLAEDGTGDLVTHGTMFDINKVKRFTFTQRTSIIPGGLRLEYDVMSLQNRIPKEFGLMLHMPVGDAAGIRVSFLPGFSECVLPKDCNGAMLSSGRSRAVLLLEPDGPLCAIVADEPTEWKLLDDRQWQLNTFRLVGCQPAHVDPLGKGDAVKLSLDILLGQSALKTWQMTPWEFELDRSGRLAARSDGRKVMEAGLWQNGETAGWLFEHKISGAVLTQNREDGSTTASGTVYWEDAESDYRVRVEADGDSVVVSLGLVQRPAGRRQGESQLLLAIPASELAAPPLQEEGTAEDAPAQDKEATVLHTVQLALRAGATATLVAGVPWTVQNGKAAGTDAYLLSIPLKALDKDRLETQVHFALSRVAAAPQE